MIAAPLSSLIAPKCHRKKLKKTHHEKKKKQTNKLFSTHGLLLKTFRQRFHARSLRPPARVGNDSPLMEHPEYFAIKTPCRPALLPTPRSPPGPYPHGAPHGSLLCVVGLHLQDVRGVLLPVQVPHASHHQPRAGIDPKVVVLVSWGKVRWMLRITAASVLATHRALPGSRLLSKT